MKPYVVQLREEDERDRSEWYALDKGDGIEYNAITRARALDSPGLRARVVQGGYVVWPPVPQGPYGAHVERTRASHRRKA